MKLMQEIKLCHHWCHKLVGQKLVDYRRWFFGHYHFDVSVGKRKECIYKRIIKLEKIGPYELNSSMASIR